MMGIALLLAVAAVLVAARWISAKASNATHKVAVARVDIALGSRVTPETVKMVDWPATAMPPGAFTDLKMLEARVARTTIQLGEPLMETKLAPPGTQGGLSAVVAQGKRAMTVRVNDVVGVAGFALPGNFVDIIVNTQSAGAGGEHAISKIVLERILVLAVAQEVGRDETKPRVVNAVTLEVTPAQAENLDLARSVGTLSLVLRNQVDQKTVATAGITKEELFGGKKAIARPVLAVKPHRAAPPPLQAASAQCVQVIQHGVLALNCF